MKITDLIISLFVFTAATGTASATKTAVALQDVYIEAQFVQYGPWICIDTNKDCDAPNGFSCNITITTTSIGNKTIQGRQTATACSILLTYTNAALKR